MFRKFAAALVAVGIAFGAVFAEEVKGTFVKFAEGTLTLKVGETDKDYKIPADLKMKRKGKDGNEEEVSVSESLDRRNKDANKMTVVLTVDGEKVTGVMYEGGRGGKDKGKGKEK